MDRDNPGYRPTRTGTPNRDSLDRDLAGQRPPDRDFPKDIESPGQRAPEGAWDQADRQQVTSYRDLLPGGQNDKRL